MSDAEIKRWPTKEWQPLSRPALFDWLSPERADGDKERLHAIGNIVMPEVCWMAVQVLGHQSRLR